MARRFSRLEYARKLLKTSSTSPEGSAPAGSFLETYQRYARGDIQITINRDADSLPGKLNRVGISAFGSPYVADQFTEVTFSNRAAQEAIISTLITASNHESVDNAIPPDKGFIPAKFTVFITSETPSTTTETSTITGLSYQKRDGASFTVPYGQNNTNQFETQVRANIFSAFNNVSRATTITFNSEEFKSRGT